MSTLNKLARMARAFSRGHGNAERPGGLGTSRRSNLTGTYIEKPPIERTAGGLRRAFRRGFERAYRPARLQQIQRQELLDAPVPPQIGPTPPPPPGPVPLDTDSGGVIPPPFPAGRRQVSDEWIEEFLRRKQQKALDEEAEDEIEILGRSYDYDEEDFAMISQGAVQVSSSNVYSYFWQPESKTMGVLYVTFLAPAPGKQMPRQGPGPTYAYYGVTTQKYRAFRKQAAESPGKAVWDHLRVRGTIFGHQVQYRLIAVTGDYIPRKATKAGFRTRYLKPVGRPGQVNARLPRNATQKERELARRGFRKSTLPPQDFAMPDRGNPDRGTPNRG